MTGLSQINRAIRACRDAGLPVIDERSCTCRLRGRLVVMRYAHGLRLMWPCSRPCPIHSASGRAANLLPDAWRRPVRAPERLGLRATIGLTRPIAKTQRR
jgi:hypothetical protein